MAFTSFVSRCLHGKPPVIHGDSQQTSDFTYVKDVVDANETLLRTNAVDGEIVNIGSGGRITNEELTTVIRDEIDSDIQLVYDDARKGDTEHTHANIKKAEKCLTINQVCQSEKVLDVS